MLVNLNPYSDPHWTYIHYSNFVAFEISNLKLLFHLNLKKWKNVEDFLQRFLIRSSYGIIHT